jgi:hypothetical protein
MLNALVAADPLGRVVADASMGRAGLESGTPAQADFRNGLETQKVCDAVLERARSGRWMEVAQ